MGNRLNIQYLRDFMFSKIIRLGALIPIAAILSSCGGGTGQTETQQSTPEGLFTGPASIYINANGVVSSSAKTATGAPGIICNENMLMFVNYGGTFYSFFSVPGAVEPNGFVTPNVISASSGQFTFSGGVLGSSNVLQVTPPNGIGVSSTSPNGSFCGVPIVDTNGVNNQITSPTFNGAYTTGINLGGTFNYPNVVDAAGDFEVVIPNTSFTYDTGYQGVQSLATLAGTYSGTVSTSQFSEQATFTFSSASVPANSGNQFGVALVTGTGASGCTYNGTASPLFKGNGYNLYLNSGNYPCQLATSQFAGLVYLDTKNNFLYSFSPTAGAARTDGLIFTGTRN
jgi:hypothetical protein